MKLLSADVRAGLTAKAGAGKILKVESLTKKESLSHTSQDRDRRKKSEIQVGPDGKPLDQEE